jgi:predicted metalloprotease
MSLARLITYASFCVTLSACGGGGDSGEAQSVTGLSYPAGVRAVANPAYSCGPTGPFASEVGRDLNNFWQSSVYTCSCQYDAPSICQGGGFVGQDPGYVYYDALALDRLFQISGSRLPADMVIAHEYGHAVQLWLGLNTVGKFKELQADCLAGFYIGSRIRRGSANQTDVSQAFLSACSYGDQYIAPWFSPGAHGTCQERVSSVQRGIAGNLNGLTPGGACS